MATFKTYRERVEEVRNEIIAEMELMRSRGMTLEKIGSKYDMSRAAVNNFLKGYYRVERPVKK